ncbi:PREDICTED: orexigenic neuropeptide QRFP [Myotis brandtii]|uniref:orexigenic neuropeptide QRFP n=1 Tax=Myotis brandtii TaxID=109478 RepID=UPI0007041C36|nr:PREDICTED: orexigenic neuropeptide QRFP [Myotis brandtii]
MYSNQGAGGRQSGRQSAGGSPRELHKAGRPGHTRTRAHSLQGAAAAMVRLHLLSCLLLLPLAACFPLLDREAPMDTTGGTGGGMRWADLAGRHKVHFLEWRRALHLRALLLFVKELEMLGRALFGLADGEKASSPLGTLADEISGLARALLIMAKELQMLGRERAGFGLRFRRQDDGRGEAGSLLADGEKASSPLGTLADEISGHDKKKGGFHFRFGRR